jgi:predicted SAM-dependent methyltransferase
MDFYASFKKRVIFELTSFIGRHLFSKRTRIKLVKQPLLLDIGVGSNFTNGWVHVDFFAFPLNPIKFIRWYFLKQQQPRPEIECDLRFPLNCENNIVDGIYSSHTIEHLLPNHAGKLVNEMFRVLKPGKYVRLVVPDFGITVKNYLNKKLTPDQKVACEIIMGYTQCSGHFSTWDEEYLKSVLSEAGFININVVEFGKGGSDKRLIKEENARKEESIVIEAQKPLN